MWRVAQRNHRKAHRHGLREVVDDLVVVEKAPECPLLWTPNENNVGRWKIVQDANNTVGCHPKQIRAKDDAWPVCNMCYEDRCCALDEEKCCVFDRRLVLNISFLVFLVLVSCCWGCWKGEKEAARKARLLAAVSHSDA